MTSDEYIKKALETFENPEIELIEDTQVMQEECFKVRWGSKVKICNFITYFDEIEEITIKEYSKSCVVYALKKKKMIHPNVISNNVLISENVHPEAIKFALKRSKLHTKASEYPIIVDLTNEKVYFYEGLIIYGILYAGFERQYINDHFRSVFNKVD